ncbi:MAG: prenyltransferase/squalene oxidase repeat-containing protein [Nocardioides sp.]
MRPLLRSAVGLIAGALIVTAVPSAAYAAPDDLSGNWLERQLTDGLIHNDQFDFDDYGLTADTALALAAIGGRRGTVREIRTALAQRVDSWTTGVDFGSDDVYAGSTAKAVVVAQTTGADPRGFGNVDLVRRLNDRVSSTTPIVGRIEDRSETDFANTIGQAFAAQGLSVARSGRADAVVRFLLKQQCSRGFFRLNFADKAAADQTCDGGDKATSSPDTDVTALAVLSLRALPRKTAKVRSALIDAVSWLKRRQQDNGSFGGGTATKASNANSTGLAGWALGESGACESAAKAAQWVRKRQVSGDVSGTPLAGEKGAIAYDRDRFAAGQAEGIGTADRDQWRRATSQAAPALSYLSVAACRNN